MTSTWVRRGERRRVPYENPQRRRLNALAATVQSAEGTALHWLLARRPFTAADLLSCLEQLAVAALPTVVVLDNAAFHRARVVREALPRLWERRVYLYYLPPYSPELNAIERLFRVLKHHQLPERAYATFNALETAVDHAFTGYEDSHCLKPPTHPGLAA